MIFNIAANKPPTTEKNLYKLAFFITCDGKKINWYDLSFIFLSYFSHSKRECSGLHDR